MSTMIRKDKDGKILETLDVADASGVKALESLGWEKGRASDTPDPDAKTGPTAAPKPKTGIEREDVTIDAAPGETGVAAVARKAASAK